MGKFKFPDSNSDFCKLYKKLWKLVARENPNKDIKKQAIGIIEVLFYYLSGLEGMIGDFDLNRIIQDAGLSNLEIDYLSGNLRSSHTLRKLQKKFSLNSKIKKSTLRHSKVLPKSELVPSSLSGKDPPDRNSSIRDSKRLIGSRRKSGDKTISCTANKS